MTNVSRTAIYRKDDNEFLGYVVQDTASWLAQTIFGYTIERTASRAAAEAAVRTQGLSFLMGVWQYYDKDDRAWYPCVIQEANEHRVTVIRTNVMGYQEPDTYKKVTLLNPTENTLIKSS
jgi:hypothetical protein